MVDVSLNPVLRGRRLLRFENRRIAPSPLVSLWCFLQCLYCIAILVGLRHTAKGGFEPGGVIFDWGGQFFFFFERICVEKNEKVKDSVLYCTRCH